MSSFVAPSGFALGGRTALFTVGRRCDRPRDSRGYEFQVTRVNCFLRDSHSEPDSSRGATSIRRGISLKTAAAFQERPSRVRYSPTFRGAALLVNEKSCTIISPRN